MSNRFHAKYHRKNHHTYGNATNPEASHDPIASPEQPFLGDFCLQGALSAVAPLSAYAAYFHSLKTGVRTNGGEIGISAYSLNTPLSTAYGKNILHGVVGINKNTISNGYALDVLGNTNLDGNLNVTGDVEIDGGDLTVSTGTFNLANTTATTVNFAGAATNIQIGAATGTTNVNNNLDVDGDINIDGGDLAVSTTNFNLANTTATTVNFAGAATTIEIGATTGTTNINNNLEVDGTVKVDSTTQSTSTTTGALVVDGGAGIAKNLNVGGSLIINGTDESTSCSTGALVIKGGVGIEKNLNVCGNLKVNGEFTYLHTNVEVTSAITIENSGTGPALKVTQYGTQPIAHFIDVNGDDIVFSDNGFVGIGTFNPNEKLTVNGRVSATGFRANQGSPSDGDSSINGYSFSSDGDTGLFSPIVNGGSANGIVSLYSNNVEKLRVDGTNVTIYQNLIVTGDSRFDGDVDFNGSVTISNIQPNAPISTTQNYSVTQSDHDKTILANHNTNTINIQLPTGLIPGTQVSVIRVGAGIVQFERGTGTPGMSSTPTNDFKKLAFIGSSASAYWTGISWYLVGDLLS